MLNAPSVSGINKTPFTLTVASGEVSPATVTKSDVTTDSSAGADTSRLSSPVWGSGAGLGVEVGVIDRGVGVTIAGAAVAAAMDGFVALGEIVGNGARLGGTLTVGTVVGTSLLHAAHRIDITLRVGSASQTHLRQLRPPFIFYHR